MTVGLIDSHSPLAHPLRESWSSVDRGQSPPPEFQSTEPPVDNRSHQYPDEQPPKGACDQAKTIRIVGTSVGPRAPQEWIQPIPVAVFPGTREFTVEGGATNSLLVSEEGPQRDNRGGEGGGSKDTKEGLPLGVSVSPGRLHGRPDALVRAHFLREFERET